MTTIIAQRVLPHYRIPLFEALYDRFGWTTVTSSNPPKSTFLNTAEAQTCPWLKTYRFDFGADDNEYQCALPWNQIVEELRPDRVISEFSLHMDSWRVLPWLRLKGGISSYALWSHGWNMELGFRTPSHLWKQAARIPPMLPADMLLTYCGAGRDWLKRIMPWKRIIALGNTLDIDRIEEVSRVAPPTRFGSPQLLAVGRLKEDKKLDALLDVHKIVQRSFPGAALTIIGDGPLRGALEIAAADIPNVRFLGAIYDEVELAPHFLGADFFAIAGAAGLSVNQALAYRLPVVAFERGRWGGWPYHHPEIEFVEPNVSGLLCREPTVEAMAAMIVDACHRDEARRLRESMEDFVDRKLRLSNMIDQFAEVDKLL
jgi:glycosyltransferase involved in cell wall biosynthesis